MFESAYLKIDRATKHILDLNELISKSPPFSYILETNVETGNRSTRAKKNESVIDAFALIAGDAFHNIRAALDHAYWERVSPFATNDRERRNVQFPFSETAARLDKAVKNRLAGRVSPAFFKTLMDLKPHGETGGNVLLYLIYEFDTLDKHKLLIPTGDYTRISSESILRQVPDFPRGFINAAFGMNAVDAQWRISSTSSGPGDKVEQKLDVPVDIIFPIARTGNLRPAVPTLHQLVDVAKVTIREIGK